MINTLCEIVKDFKITSNFNEKRTWPNGQIYYHDGVDFISEKNERSIFAMADGIITYLFDEYNEKERWNLHSESTAGKYCIIQSEIIGKKYYIRPFHFEQIFVRNGQQIKAGDVLGLYGDTGYSFGAHVHLSIFDENWKIVNPETVVVTYFDSCKTFIGG